MKQSLQLKVSQQLTLTPQLQQSIRLLQLSTVDLQTEVERFLQENPLLERGDEPAAESAPADAAGGDTEPERQDTESGDSGGELSDWGSGSRRHEDGDDYDPMANVPRPVTLREHLLAQLGEIALPERDSAIVQLLIEELDEDGYLTVDLQELAASLPLELGLEEDELAFGLKLLQQFEPQGVGARSLSESLALQLAQLPDTTPGKALARTIVSEHLTLLGNRDYTRLKRLLDVGDVELKEAQALIARLNPRPAAGFGADDTRYIIPDIAVRRVKGRWRAELNNAAVPRLRVNQMYAQSYQQTLSEASGKRPNGW